MLQHVIIDANDMISLFDECYLSCAIKKRNKNENNYWTL